LDEKVNIGMIQSFLNRVKETQLMYLMVLLGIGVVNSKGVEK
jgi:hypothetical protein